jgi:hypothetical protein
MGDFKRLLEILAGRQARDDDEGQDDIETTLHDDLLF